MDIFREDWANLPVSKRSPRAKSVIKNWWIHMDVSWLWTRDIIGADSVEWMSQIISSQNWTRWLVNSITEWEASPIVDVVTFKWWNIVTKWPEDSEVLDGHLRWMPLVPGVIQKWLLLKLSMLSQKVYYWINATKTKFERPILPRSIIKFNEDTKELQNENWETHISIELIDDFKVNLRVKYNKLEEQFLLEKDLDKYLLQTWKFRFATWFSWIENEDSANPKVWDIFQWYFAVPSDFHFHQQFDKSDIVTPYLLEEFAAQIWSISFWDKFNTLNDDWTVDEDKRTVLTFNSSTCKLSWKSLKLWDTFRLVGRVKTIEKRTASFEYIGYDSEWNVIIEWEITGNIVPMKVLKRLIK